MPLSKAQQKLLGVYREILHRLLEKQAPGKEDRRIIKSMRYRIERLKLKGERH